MVLLSFQDITVRKDARQLMRSSPPSFQSSDDAFEQRPSRHIVQLEPRAESIFGYTRDEAIGKPGADPHS